MNSFKQNLGKVEKIQTWRTTLPLEETGNQQLDTLRTMTPRKATSQHQQSPHQPHVTSRRMKNESYSFQLTFPNGKIWKSTYTVFAMRNAENSIRDFNHIPKERRIDELGLALLH